MRRVGWSAVPISGLPAWHANNEEHAPAMQSVQHASHLWHNIAQLGSHNSVNHQRSVAGERHEDADVTDLHTVNTISQ